MTLLTNISNFSNPTGLEYIASVSVTFITAIFLCVVGFLSTFKTKRVIDFHISRNAKNKAWGPLQDRYKRNSEKRSFRINMKVCGIVFMICGIALFIYAIKVAFK